MQAILGVTVPFFALVLCGYLAARSHTLPQAAIPGLNAFVLFFALPCMLFRLGASTPFAQLIDPTLIGLYAVCALAMVAFTVAMTLRSESGGPGVDLKNAAFGALVAAFPNSGFMGVPLLVALFGERAAGPVIGTLLVDLFLTSSLCIALAQMHTHRAGGPEPDGRTADVPLATAVLRSIRGTLANPLPWAIGFGALFSLAGWTLPGAVGRSSGCWATPPRRWRCSRSAPCCGAPDSTPTR